MTFSVVIDGYIYTSGTIFYYPSGDSSSGPAVEGDASRTSAQLLTIDDDIADVRTGPIIEEYNPGKGIFIQGWI